MNREHYPDPTAERAIANVMREEHNRKDTGKATNRLVRDMMTYIEKESANKEKSSL